MIKNFFFLQTKQRKLLIHMEIYIYSTLFFSNTWYGKNLNEIFLFFIDLKIEYFKKGRKICLSIF